MTLRETFKNYADAANDGFFGAFKLAGAIVAAPVKAVCNTLRDFVK